MHRRLSDASRNDGLDGPVTAPTGLRIETLASREILSYELAGQDDAALRLSKTDPLNHPFRGPRLLNTTPANSLPN